MTTKPKLAVWKFSSCDGCQLSLLDCEDELLAVAGEEGVACLVGLAAGVAVGVGEELGNPGHVVLLAVIGNNDGLVNKAYTLGSTQCELYGCAFSPDGDRIGAGLGRQGDPLAGLVEEEEYGQRFGCGNDGADLQV